jgi:hypothetical protein
MRMCCGSKIHNLHGPSNSDKPTSRPVTLLAGGSLSPATHQPRITSMEENVMGTNDVALGRASWIVVSVLLMTFSVSCSFTGLHVLNFCKTFDELPLTASVQTSPIVGLENLGTIKVMNGSGTATLDHGDFIRVEHGVAIPDYANKATVFLNGWKLSYRGADDQNVVGLSTLVSRIRLEGKKLTWNAMGILSDNHADEPYTWTYYYTVIAWNDTVLDVRVNHDDADNFCQPGTGASDNFYFAPNRGTSTALSSFSSFLQNPDFPPIGTVAILPRGFGFSWNNDHNLLQLAYNLDYGETFVEHGKKYQKAFEEIPAPLPTPSSSLDARFISWNTYSIIKDNELRYNYQFGEMVSALGGRDVGVRQPPFSILPLEELGGNACIPQGDFHGVHTEDFVIENVPSEYAIPMLTGWELRYPCDDENVKEIGIWIDKWQYVKDPTAATGRLSYTLSSVLRDKDDNPGHNRRHKVTILGLRPTTSVTAKPGTPH